MSDHWEVFPCQMGDHVAWISYNHGIRDEIAKLPLPNIVKFKVPLRAPDDRGLPQGDEFASLNSIEEDLDSALQATGGVFVGRITTNGARHFYFYTAGSKQDVTQVAERVSAKHDRKLHFLTEADLDRTAYWNKLFPTKDDWRVILDMRVESALREAGDDLQTPRPIEHFAYFKTATGRDRFLEQVRDRFASVQETSSADQHL